MSFENRRDAVLDALEASLQAFLPARLVSRGLPDPAVLGDAKLKQGHYALVAGGMEGWNTNVGAEATEGRLRFTVVFHGLVGPSASTRQVEALEGTAQAELLAWLRAPRAGDISTVYPVKATYSQGLDCPMAWLALEMEALYV